MASLLTLLLLASAASESVLARNGSRGGHSGGHSGGHHGGHRAAVGLMFAAPAFWLFRAPIYAPSVVAAPSAPPVYIEQGDAQPVAVQSAGDWWYYCAESKAYYPYVKECAQEWQRVAAEPPVSR
jgi:hypothetical protein